MFFVLLADNAHNNICLFLHCMPSFGDKLSDYPFLDTMIIGIRIENIIVWGYVMHYPIVYKYILKSETPLFLGEVTVEHAKNIRLGYVISFTVVMPSWLIRNKIGQNKSDMRDGGVVSC